MKSNELLDYINNYDDYTELTQKGIDFINAQIKSHIDKPRTIKTIVWSNYWLNGSLILLLITAMFFSTLKITTKECSLKNLSKQVISTDSIWNIYLTFFKVIVIHVLMLGLHLSSNLRLHLIN